MSYNNLVGKIFEDLSGNVVSVKEIDGSIAHLDSGQRIAVERLMDNSFYNEHIDPDIFSSKESNFYSFLGDQIRNIDTNSMGTMDGGIQINNSIPVVESHQDSQSALRGDYTPSHDQYDEIERRKREMMENAANISRNINNSNSKLRELIGEDGDDEDNIPINRNLEGVTIEGSNRPIQQTYPRETSVSMFDENNTPIGYVENKLPAPPVVPKEDPIYQMFSQVKRTTNFSLNVKLIEKIPRKDFMKMWEDSYEVSIIDYLVDEFTEKLLNDPSMIRDQLKEALKVHIYGKTTPKKTTPKKTTTKKTSKK